MSAPSPTSPAPDAVRGRLAVAAALTFAAGVVHVAAAVPHFGDDTLLGSAFTITGWAQIVIAALLLRRRPSRAAAWAALATHGLALGALLVARTVGLPVGHGGVEPVTLPDATTAVLEVLALVVLAGWLRRPHRLGASRPAVIGALSVAGLLALGGSTVAVASLGTSGHGHAAEEPADAHAAAPHGHEETGTATTGTTTATDERVHVHDDDSIHVHAAGDGHEHADGTVHVHAAAPTAERTEEDAPAGSHTHAPGEGH